MARRLGLLGPIIVAVGVLVALIGAYLVVHNRPKAGAVIETVVVDPTTSIVVRAEDGGERSFVELHAGDEVKWQALVPHYGGRPGATGIAWNEIAVSVRVIRDGRAEVFALSMQDASKLGGIHLGDGALKTKDLTGPVTLTDHVRSYELIEGEGWNQLIGIDLATGKKLWTTDLGSKPVTSGIVTGGLVRLEQAGEKHYYRVFTGREDRSSEATGIPLVPPTPAP
jgi:hypothetical protein